MHCVALAEGKEGVAAERPFPPQPLVQGRNDGCSGTALIWRTSWAATRAPAPAWAAGRCVHALAAPVLH